MDGSLPIGKRQIGQWVLAQASGAYQPTVWRLREK